MTPIFINKQVFLESRRSSSRMLGSMKKSSIGAALYLTPGAASKRRATSSGLRTTAMASLEHAPIDVPADLDERVRVYLDEHPEISWDAAIKAIMKGDGQG